MHGAAGLGLTVTCAFARSSVTEEHAVGIWGELPGSAGHKHPRQHRPP